MTLKKQDTEEFRYLLANRKLPLLTLDARWHEVFPDSMKTAKIRFLEAKLNELIKKQGKFVTDAKEMKKLKKKLLDGILHNMDEAEDLEEEKLKYKKQEVSQKLIRDINDQLKDNDNVLMEIPYEIRSINEELLFECIQLFYEQIKSNSEDIRAIGIWILKVREELKDKILEKQDKEIKNEAMYSYMHQVLGADVLNIFDEINR